jgi:hypothetical protein
MRFRAVLAFASSARFSLRMCACTPRPRTNPPVPMEPYWRHGRALI